MSSTYCEHYGNHSQQQSIEHFVPQMSVDDQDAQQHQMEEGGYSSSLNMARETNWKKAGCAWWLQETVLIFAKHCRCSATFFTFRSFSNIGF